MLLHRTKKLFAMCTSVGSFLIIIKRYLDTSLQKCLTHLFSLHATSYPFLSVKCIYISIHVFVWRLINFVKLNASYIHTLYVYLCYVIFPYANRVDPDQTALTRAV